MRDLAPSAAHTLSFIRSSSVSRAGETGTVLKGGDSLIQLSRVTGRISGLPRTERLTRNAMHQASRGKKAMYV
ncbi:hypothetical protein NDU88_004546 [Pleurodeles waltl]|uniref:Uncharacterized protein n=1 Tax=Pleurodeles waltl TaxID=8319 RepID=A0AAV7T7X6_PLEWA|nr:hypothetical protein NDU88_004546 [Pleurodeles waltl]